jgi:hypothetical protein
MPFFNEMTLEFGALSPVSQGSKRPLGQPGSIVLERRPKYFFMPVCFGNKSGNALLISGAYAPFTQKINFKI